MYRRKGRFIKPWMVAGGGVCRLGPAGFRARRYFDSVCGCGGAGVCIGPFGRIVAENGLNRASALMSVMVFSLILLLALLLIIVPMLVGQFNNLASRHAPINRFYAEHAAAVVENTIGGYVEIDQASIIAWLQAHTGELSNALKAWFPVLMRQGGNIVSSIGNLLLLPLLLYYFLLDWQRWSCGIAKLVPRRFVGAYTRITGNLNEVLGGFLRGQLPVMLIMGLVYGLGWCWSGWIRGLQSVWLFSILVFVPYLGAFTGLLLATVAALLQFGSWNGILAVWAVFAVGQFLESFFITPKIVGDRIGLSPFWVIFSLMAFGQLMGFVGMLAGLPLAAVTFGLASRGRAEIFCIQFYRGR